MGILDRYIARAVISGSLVALVIFVSLILIFTFVEESGDITDDYTAFIALLHVGLQAPQRAYESFPVATLIGSLMTLGGMAARSELVVMRAAGMSVLGIGRSVATAGVLLALIAVALGEWVAPPAERLSLEVKARAESGQVGALSRDGFWARDGRRFVQVGYAPSASVLETVNIYEFDEERRLAFVTSADRARYVGGEWLLEGVIVTRFVDGNVEREVRDEAPWRSDLRPEVLDVVVVDPEALSIAELWTYVSYLERNELESDRYRLAFWLKLATPLATITMLLLTIPLAFGSLRSVGAGQRIFIGVMIGIVFFLANNLLNHLGLVYGLPPVVSALLPTLVFLAIAIYTTSRVR
ncbi:lipopolysaccharide export system permease protein [Natronocella acetinitrilica]|uniref:Lipopolysaccharide export system permease protein n=1 Tax=Natronocella acetinitrilica TaxID=414046 RepID=A0AAE3G4N3_9GAMM|nr:LPS export ABC transporter permease LptG [Natronocella acetinitrilica]MCP1674999.1 lipopolysaccharide export system permease protein [Natronocella acetinitrilica]